MKSKYLFLLLIISCFSLVGCSISVGSSDDEESNNSVKASTSNDSDFKLNSPRTPIKDNSSEIVMYDDEGDNYAKGEFILYGWKKVYTKKTKNDFDNGDVKISRYYSLPLYQDTYTGCIYMLDYDDGYSPYYNEKGEVAGCFANSTNISNKDTNVNKIDILKEYYPDKEDSELEYMLESVFNADNISEEELISILENMKILKEGNKDKNGNSVEGGNDNSNTDKATIDAFTKKSEDKAEELMNKIEKAKAEGYDDYEEYIKDKGTDTVKGEESNDEK